MRAISKAPRSRMSLAASAGTILAAAIASAAAISTSSQVSYRRWSLQIRPISGWVYLAIIRTSPHRTALERHEAPGGQRQESVVSSDPIVLQPRGRIPLLQAQPIGRNHQAVHVPEHRRRQRAVLEEVGRDPLDVLGRDLVDPLQCLVETNLPIEVDLLTCEV